MGSLSARRSCHAQNHINLRSRVFIRLPFIVFLKLERPLPTTIHIVDR